MLSVTRGCGGRCSMRDRSTAFPAGTLTLRDMPDNRGPDVGTPNWQPDHGQSARVYAGLHDLCHWGGPVEPAIFDADSHLMETPDWLGGSPTSGPRASRPPRPRGRRSRRGRADGEPARALGVAPPPGDRSRRAEGPQGLDGSGALDTDVRSRVLDALQIDAQLVFPTFSLVHFSPEQGPRRALRRHRRTQPGDGRVLRARSR